MFLTNKQHRLKFNLSDQLYKIILILIPHSAVTAFLTLTSTSRDIPSRLLRLLRLFSFLQHLPIEIPRERFARAFFAVIMRVGRELKEANERVEFAHAILEGGACEHPSHGTLQGEDGACGLGCAILSKYLIKNSCVEEEQFQFNFDFPPKSPLKHQLKFRKR